MGDHHCVVLVLSPCAWTGVSFQHRGVGFRGQGLEFRAYSQVFKGVVVHRATRDFLIGRGWARVPFLKG